MRALRIKVYGCPICPFSVRSSHPAHKWRCEASHLWLPDDLTTPEGDGCPLNAGPVTVEMTRSGGEA